MSLGLLFTYGMTAFGALAGPFRPFYALLIYISFAILKPESLWPWSVPVWNYSRVVGIALLVGWAVNGFGQWRFGKGRGTVYALILFGVWSVFSAALAPNQQIGWMFVEKQAKIVLPCLAGITLVDSVAKLKQLAWVLVLSQGYLAYWFHDLYFQGIHLTAGSDVFQHAGTDNNGLAIAMCTCVGLAFFLGLTVEKWWERAIAFLCAAMMAHCVLFMFSRGGMVALIITGFVSMFLVPRKPMHYLYFLIAVIAGISMAGKEVRERFFSAFVDEKTRDEAASSRVRQWGYCVDAMEAHPLFGVGPDHWPIARTYNIEGGEAHSLWLHVGAELGVPGVMFLVSFYGLCMWRLFPLTQMRDFPWDPWLQGAARMVIASLVGFTISAQFVSLKELEQPFYVTLIGAGVLRVIWMQTMAWTPAWGWPNPQPAGWPAPQPTANE